MWIRNSAIALAMLLLATAAVFAEGMRRDILQEQNGLRAFTLSNPTVAAGPPPTCSGATFKLDYSNKCNTVYYMTIH
jgi:hypothetical protein